ncbi:MAG: Ice-binding protein [Marmoricola sp.]|nr:Ice-binding protein [Marmoricola sp.]
MSRATRRTGTNRKRLRAVIAVALGLSLSVGGAWAYWSAGSVPGGNGASAAATLGQGATPVASASQGVVTIDWASTALASGYIVKRYDATTLALQTIVTDCAGIVPTTACTENNVPAGQWVYTVTPILGTHWTGSESQGSNAVSTDSSAPVNDITASAGTGNVFKSGGTIYYRGLVAGSFTLTNTVSDAGSGPASSTTAGLAGTSAGWTHSPSTVSSPVGGPYVSNPFSWTATTASAPTVLVTGRDGAGNGTQTTLSMVDDSTPPTAGSISYPNGYQPGQAVVVTATSGTDVGSGIATRQLQRASAVLTGTTCGTFSGFADIGPDSPASPYTDNQVTDSRCYQYRLVVSDRVSNRDVATSASVAKVDSSGGGPALRTSGSYSILAATGVVNDGLTTISGDLGVSPSDSVTGFPDGIVAGTIHAGDVPAAQAQADLVLAYNDAAARTPTGPDFAGDLNGVTFHPGVYHSAAAMALTGTLTLDGDGNPNAIFVFQVSAALNTAAHSHVVLINGAQASHVFWQALGAAGTGANSTFAGTILSAGAITLGADSVLIGRALSYGTVTIANNIVRFTNALPPTVTITGGSTAVTKNATPTITGSTDAAVGTTVTVAVGGQLLTTTAQGNGTWGVTAAALLSGSYNVVVAVRDSAGNAGTTTQTLTVEINPDPVLLRTAATYSVLAGTGIINTVVTTISGDVGVSPSNSIGGFPPGVLGGTIHAGDPAAAQAQADLVLAYNDAAARRPSATFSGDMGGRTLHAGVYHTAAAFALTGNLTLDGENNPNAVFIFQVGAALNTAASSNIVLTNGAQASHVFWQVLGAAGTGAPSTFAGTILANGAITLGAGTQLDGRALSYGLVTLAGNTITTG